MRRKLHIYYLLIICIPIFFNTGCSRENISSNKAAYISANVDSEYEKTFKDLNLGILFDFNLRVSNANKSWVNIWVEGYSNGKPIEPFPLTQLYYGLSPNQVDEGQMGFGIINHNSDDPQFFLYSSGAKTNPHSIDKKFFIKSGASSWNYAISSEAIGLEYGEEVILAVYRQGKESLKTGYDYQDSKAINQMINKDTTVLLLKMKVEEKNNLEK